MGSWCWVGVLSVPHAAMPFPHPCVPAGVAVYLTLLAITAQRAHERGFWALKDTLWKARDQRARQLVGPHRDPSR